MDPQVVVLVVGLAAFVSHGPQEIFYVMLPNNAVVEQVLNHHTSHMARLTRYDDATGAYVETALTQNFSISVPGQYSFDPNKALILASGPAPLRKECLPGADLGKCTHSGPSGEVKLIDVVGTIRGGRGSMVPFSIGDSLDSLIRTEVGRSSAFIDYAAEDHPFTTLRGQALAILGDVFVVESEGISTQEERPKIQLGESSFELGLAQNCNQWTGRNAPCYPLLIINLPPPQAPLRRPSGLPTHVDLAVADAHPSVLYGLVSRQPDEPRPVPVEIVVGDPGGSPYKCRGGAIVVTTSAAMSSWRSHD